MKEYFSTLKGEWLTSQLAEIIISTSDLSPYVVIILNFNKSAKCLSFERGFLVNAERVNKPFNYFKEHLINKSRKIL